MNRAPALFAIVSGAALAGCAGGLPSPVMTPHRTDVPRPYRPICNAEAEAQRFMEKKKEPLDDLARAAGALTTPLKHLSSLIDGPGAWRDTGCNASGVGTPVRMTQHSTDDLYTIDVQLHRAEVNGAPVPAGRFIRLEVVPGWPAHGAIAKRLPREGDIIAFRGFLVWDKDKVPPHHRDGHMEIHPVEPIEFLSPEPPAN